MNFARSVFVSAFAGFVWIAALYAGYQLVRGAAPAAAWLGLLLAAAAPAAFFASLYLSPRARTARHPVGVSALCGLGLVITMVMNWRFDSPAAALIWAGACVIGWFAYLRWYSSFGARRSLFTKGARLPDFQLESLDGEQVRSAAFTGSPHVLVFYRGNWCPLCSAQAAELAARYRDLKAMGAEVLMISSQPAAHSRKLASRVKAPMRFLRDPDNQAARQLGIVAPWGTPMGLQALGYTADTAMPTVIITGEDGRVLFADETDNYRVRPEPEVFLQVLRSEGTAPDTG